MVIASIDLMGGKVVQLRQGKQKVLERDDLMELAREFDRFGEVAVIDLDAALGNGNNLQQVKQLLKTAECRVGGGIRTVDQARELIALGARKVIIGSKAFEGDRINHPYLEELATALDPQRIIIAVDALDGEIVTRGWRHRTGLEVCPVAREIEPYASELLFTCVEREGTLQGIDLAAVKKLRGATERRITAAGGVSSVAEVRQLAEIGADVQLGMALYTGGIDLAEAFAESLNWKRGLIPTITQDVEGQILMLAYSSKESLRKTFQTRTMWYQSRSRGKLWMKGETSGNTQAVQRLRADCDRDALLAIVRQTNVACHAGSYSCFGDKNFTLQELYQVIRERIEHPLPGSYTATLTDDLLREKILEEAREVVEARGRDDVIWEAADVLYFLCVLLARNEVEVGEVVHELRRRRKQHARDENQAR